MFQVCRPNPKILNLRVFWFMLDSNNDFILKWTNWLTLLWLRASKQENILAVNVTSFLFSPQSFSRPHRRHHISNPPAGIIGNRPVFSAGLSYLKSILTRFWSMPVSRSVCSLAWTRDSACLSLIWHCDEIQNFATNTAFHMDESVTTIWNGSKQNKELMLGILELQLECRPSISTND